MIATLQPGALYSLLSISEQSAELSSAGFFGSGICLVFAPYLMPTMAMP